MTNKLKINSFYNIMGGIIPGLVALIFLPIILKNLGDDLFSIYLIILLLVSSSGIFDFGLARTITQEISMSNNIVKRSSILFNGLLSLFIIGLFFSIVIGITFFYMQDLNFIYSEIYKNLLPILLMVLITILSTGLRGYLEGLHSFQIINVNKIIFGSAIIIVSYLISLYSISISIIINSLLIIKIFQFAMLFFYIKFYEQKLEVKINIREVSKMLAIGKWFAISNLIGPLMMYIDRFIVSTILVSTMFNYYALSMEVAVKILILPIAIVNVFFPLIAGIMKKNISKDILDTYEIKMYIYIFFLVVTPIIILFIFSKDFLSLWISNDFAEESFMTFRIILIGIIFSSLAQIPFTLLQGIGYAKNTAYVHMIIIFPYVIVLYYITLYYGNIGAAFVWVGRIFITLFLFNVIYRYKKDRL